MTRETSTGVPVIDVAALVDSSASASSRTRCAEAIGAACRALGFFYVQSHGVPEATATAMLAAARRFFALPLEQKMRLHLRDSRQFRGYVPMGGEITDGGHDAHECLDLQPCAEVAARGAGHVLDDAGQWPRGVAGFRDAAMAHWDAMTSLSRALVEGLAASLGLPDDGFAAFAGTDLCDLRLAHYPPAGGGGTLGMGAHHDLGFLAVLLQDGIGGLEVRAPDGAWIAAPHVEGTFLVNIGLMVQRWTNDRYKASWHRVAVPRDAHRYSVPFFYEPRPDATIAPLAIFCGADDPPRYPPLRFGDYLGGQFAKAYKP